jgi:hypothetical protein
MAGNIIHAIATTNAIISGLIVTEALKVLAGEGRRRRHLAPRPAAARCTRFQHPCPVAAVSMHEVPLRYGCSYSPRTLYSRCSGARLPGRRAQHVPVRGAHHQAPGGGHDRAAAKQGLHGVRQGAADAPHQHRGGLRPRRAWTAAQLHDLPSTGAQRLAAMPRLLFRHRDAPRSACAVQAATLSSLLSGVIKKRLAISQPNLMCGGFMYEEGESCASAAALRPHPLATALQGPKERALSRADPSCAGPCAIQERAWRRTRWRPMLRCCRGRSRSCPVAACGTAPSSLCRSGCSWRAHARLRCLCAAQVHVDWRCSARLGSTAPRNSRY